MNAAHTPTPWHVVTIDGSIGSIEAEDGSPVAQAQPRGTLRHPDHAERRANADFIVRAVNCHDDLVDALEAFLDVGNCKASRDMAIAALTKAKGGQGE